jgi:hypothetical protein
VESDDPFTLGLLIKNKGYGAASNLKLSSAQPEIVENEKGLLIDFKIEKAFVNNQQQSNSLNLDFGNLNAFEFKHVVWELKTSLRGTFMNLNATYTNTNPNGDPKLSLIDRLEYNQLARLVKVDQPSGLNDFFADFLVFNEFSLLPDRVYVSSVKTDMLNVSFIENVTALQMGPSEIRLKIVNNDTRSLSNAWFYAGLFMDSKTIPENLKIFKVLRNDGRVLPIENVWTRKFDKTQSVLNIFDFVSNVDYDLVYEIQIRDLNYTEPETTTMSTTTATTTIINSSSKTSTQNVTDTPKTTNNNSCKYFY